MEIVKIIKLNVVIKNTLYTKNILKMFLEKQLSMLINKLYKKQIELVFLSKKDFIKHF